MNDEEMSTPAPNVRSLDDYRNRGGSSGESPLVRGFDFTEKGNAERFASKYGHDVRWCADWGKWFVFDGSRWVVDNVGQVMRLAKLTCESLLDEEQPASWSLSRDFQKEKWAHYMKTSERKGLSAMLSLAQSELPIPVRPEDFDRNPWLLNLENGTYDFEADEFRPAAREDLITKQAAVTYDESAQLFYDATLTGEAASKNSVWLRILHQYFTSDQELIQFIARSFGYSMTGDTSERVVFLFQGKPDAGKSTLLKFMHRLLAEYAVRIPTESLMQRKGGGGGVPNDIARLRGARLVSASETDEDKRLSEAKLKELSGNDIVTARFMRAEFFDFEPSHKLFIGTNHMPRIYDSSGATWNRIRLVAFNNSIKKDEQDPHLIDKLDAEKPAIFNWLLEGFRSWREHGLGTATAVTAATDLARAEQDQLGVFLDDCTQAMGEIGKDELYNRYKRWCEDGGSRVLTKTKFGKLMVAHGFDPDKRHGNGGSRYWEGVSLREGQSGQPAIVEKNLRESAEKAASGELDF
jgi:putative DNA primase/helicase